MKVEIKNANVLQLSSVPWFLGLLNVGIILTFLFAAFNATDSSKVALFLGISVLVGGGGFCLVARRSDVAFDKTKNTVRISERSLFGKTRKQLNLSEIHEAILETSDIGRGPPNHRVALVVKGGPHDGCHPLTRNYFSGLTPEVTRDAINTWLRGKE